jgi:hypothetical protein
MRVFLFAAVVGATALPAFAGPSDHQGRRFGDFSRTERPELNRQDRGRNAPYALTGRTTQRRVLQYRDTPSGRGQTSRQAYWTWVSE